MENFFLKTYLFVLYEKQYKVDYERENWLLEKGHSKGILREKGLVNGLNRLGYLALLDFK